MLNTNTDLFHVQHPNHEIVLMSHKTPYMVTIYLSDHYQKLFTIY